MLTTLPNICEMAKEMAMHGVVLFLPVCVKIKCVRLSNCARMTLKSVSLSLNTFGDFSLSYHFLFEMSCKEFPKSSVSKFGEALPCIQSHVRPFGCYLLTLWRTFPRLPHHSVYLQLTNFISLRIPSGNVHAVHGEQSERINRQ